MTEEEIIEQIKAAFEENYEILRMEGIHAMTHDIKQLALDQVLFYYEKMRDVAERVTDTEVELTLPEQRTPAGRRFTIRGVVDIVHEEEETWMYDIKTHDLKYIENNIELYQQQLDVYAHIWQNLRGEKLDHTAIISTAIPRPILNASRLGNNVQLTREKEKWQPMVEIPLQQYDVDEMVAAFGEVVDCIEDKKFTPVSVERIKRKESGEKQSFVTRVCRNCDARFSCSSFREYVREGGDGVRTAMKRYFDDFGSEIDQENWVNENLSQTSEVLETLEV